MKVNIDQGILDYYSNNIAGYQKDPTKIINSNRDIKQTSSSNKNSL